MTGRKIKTGRLIGACWLMVSIGLPSLLRPLSVSAQQRYKTGDGKGAFVTGKYPNLFLERGHSKGEINEKISAAYKQLFEGDPETQSVYFPAGKNSNGPLAYISDVPHDDIRTEGMSYGMIIAVQLNKKDVFDALWNYAMTRMYISDVNHPSEGYFAWSLKRDGTPNEETPAPDGEEYFAMSLYFASGRWGDGQGIYNYRKQADKILTTMRHHPVKKGMTKFGLRTIGPMVNEQHKMICFVPGTENNNYTDPSYQLPAFYELWGRCGPKADRTFWLGAADSSRVFFTRAANTGTGLGTERANFDGTPFKSKNPNAVSFSFDSWRTASNWSVDWAWWHKAVVEQELSNRIQAFFTLKGMDTYGCQFTPDGRQLDNRHAKGLVAANAVTSLAATSESRNSFVDALWNSPVPQALGERYYDGLLYIMSLLHCSGNFRIYMPAEK